MNERYTKIDFRKPDGADREEETRAELRRLNGLTEVHLEAGAAAYTGVCAVAHPAMPGGGPPYWFQFTTDPRLCTCLVCLNIAEPVISPGGLDPYTREGVEKLESFKKDWSK